MKIIRLSISALVAAFATALVAHAQDTQTEATVTAISGSVTIKLPDGSSSPATPGMKLPQGAEIITGVGAQATIQSHEGIVSVLGEKADATLNKLSVSASGMRNAEIGLKSGSIASSLDPAKKSSNNYGVRTIKGVAAARGTNYSVTIDGATYTVAVGSGSVDSNGTSVPSGNVYYTPAGGGAPVVTTLAALVASQPATASSVVSLIATAVASNPSSTAQSVGSVVQTLAASAGSGTNATNVVAAAAAAASATFATQSGQSGNATAITTTIANAAVAGAVTAGNSQGAGAIVTTTAIAVTTATSTLGTSVVDVKSNAAALATTVANVVNGTSSTPGTTGALAGSGNAINTTTITNTVNSSTIAPSSVGAAPTVTTSTGTAATVTTPTSTGGTSTPTTINTTQTPSTPIVDPGIVSASGGHP